MWDRRTRRTGPWKSGLRYTGALGALAVLAILLFGAGPSFAAEAWRVKSASGAAEIEATDGTLRPAAADDKVRPGEKVRTGEGGRVVLTRKGDTITVAPGSAMQAADTSTFTRIVQTLGTLLFKVESRPSWGFEVETPYLAAVVKGTTFSVSVAAQGAAVHVIAGRVQVATPDRAHARLIRPGQTATVRPSAQGGTGGITVIESRTDATPDATPNGADA